MVLGDVEETVTIHEIDQETEEEIRAKIKRLKGKVADKHKVNARKLRTLIESKAFDDFIVNGIEYMRYDLFLSIPMLN